MHKFLFLCAILFMLICPVFGLRYVVLKNKISEELKDLEQRVTEENITILKSWAAINGYAAAMSLTIAFILIIWLFW